MFNFFKSTVNINYNNILNLDLVESKESFTLNESKYFTNKKCGDY